MAAFDLTFTDVKELYDMLDELDINYFKLVYSSKGKSYTVDVEYTDTKNGKPVSISVHVK
jgi:cytoplasmic iron level regulating protein YaaA (DUF328/UPF0246 family)